MPLLLCGDCQAPMVLKNGQYGAFYGCTNFDVTGCRGSLTADPDGTPLGIPGNQETRRARAEVLRLRERTFGSYSNQDLADAIDRPKGFRVGDLTLEECEILIALLQETDLNEALRDPTVWTALQGDLFELEPK